jgi:hypothetical protein
MPQDKEKEEVKRLLLEDIEAAGGLDAVGKGKVATLRNIRSFRAATYSKVDKSTLENWLNYWRKLDRAAYLALLRENKVKPAAEPDYREPVPADEPEKMASTAGGPGGRRGNPPRGNNNNNNNNNNKNNNNNPPDPPAAAGLQSSNHTGTFQRESCLRFLLASNLVTHMCACFSGH